MSHTIETPTAVEVLEIPSVANLDQITVYWHNYELGKGMVTIVCYGSAWTSWFGAMSGQTIQRFFEKCDVSYLVGNLSSGQWAKRTRQHEKYLRRIVEAVKAALNATGCPMCDRGHAAIQASISREMVHTSPQRMLCERVSEVCRYCRCTETTPCITPDGPCAWVDRRHTVCSAGECMAKAARGDNP